MGKLRINIKSYFDNFNFRFFFRSNNNLYCIFSTIQRLYTLPKLYSVYGKVEKIYFTS